MNILYLCIRIYSCVFLYNNNYNYYTHNIRLTIMVTEFNYK